MFGSIEEVRPVTITGGGGNKYFIEGTQHFTPETYIYRQSSELLSQNGISSTFTVTFKD